MYRGLYNAVSTMNTAQKRLDAASNNMANANTTGYKRDIIISEAFPEVLMTKINGTEPTRPYGGNAQVKVEREGEAFRLSTGGGFFAVNTRLGNSFDKAVAFARDDNGFLRTYERNAAGEIETKYGNDILDAAGRPIQTETENIDVDEFGRVTDNGQVVAELLRRPGGNIIGTMNSGVRLEKFATDFTQGSLEQTMNPLDLALSGKGFFVIYKPDSEDIFYSRDGHFTLNDNGDIITQEGYFLGSATGSSIMVDGENFAVTPQGQVLVDGEVREQIEIVDFANLSDLRKVGENLYRFEEQYQPEYIEPEGLVLQGFLEESNVNVVDQMVEMITVMRAHEAGAKVVSVYDEMLNKAVNEIGRG